MVCGLLNFVGSIECNIFIFSQTKGEKKKWKNADVNSQNNETALKRKPKFSVTQKLFGFNAFSLSISALRRTKRFVFVFQHARLYVCLCVS